MKIAEADHPFYKPLWRRVLLVAVIGGWAAYETLVVRDPMWMVLTIGLFVYAAVTFLLRWPREGQGEATKEPADKA